MGNHLASRQRYKAMLMSFAPIMRCMVGFTHAGLEPTSTDSSVLDLTYGIGYSTGDYTFESTLITTTFNALSGRWMSYFFKGFVQENEVNHLNTSTP